MAETTAIIHGAGIYKNFLSDLSQVMDHSYDIDEIFVHYRDWVRRGELFVDDFVMPMFPPSYNGKELIESEDYIALRNAMINLYCALDHATPGMDRRRVCHAAYSEDDEAIIIVLR